MTTVDNPDNVVFDSGGSNQIIIETTNVEEIKTKILRIVKRPVAKSGRTSGVKTNKVLDLLRVEHRWTIKGVMEKENKTKLDALFNQGGPFNMLWEGVTYDANMEKYAYTKADNENSERPVTITIIEGGDL